MKNVICLSSTWKCSVNKSCFSSLSITIPPPRVPDRGLILEIPIHYLRSHYQNFVQKKFVLLLQTWETGKIVLQTECLRPLSPAKEIYLVKS